MEIDLAQLEFISAPLRKMVLRTEQEFKALLGFRITSLYRMGDKGVHGQLPLRGIDVGCRDSQIGQSICDWVNTHYQYDPKRLHLKCCMYHDVGLGPHIHFQVHRRTVRVG